MDEVNEPKSRVETISSEVNMMSLFSSDSCVSAAATDTSSNLASSSSTPPTSVSDNISLASDAPKLESTPLLEAEPRIEEPPSTGRARRARANPTYNIAQLSGTASHGKRRAKGDDVADRRRRTVSGNILSNKAEGSSSTRPDSRDDTNKIVSEGIDALDLQWSIQSLKIPRSRPKPQESPRATRTSSRRSASAQVTSMASKISTLGKRSRKNVEKTVSRMSREILRLQDTKEFAHIDMQPVVHTIWSNGKLVTVDASDNGRAKKKAKIDHPAPKQEKEKEAVEKPEETVQVVARKGRRTKKWLDRGLYAGQEAPVDFSKGLSALEKKKLSQIPELTPSGRVNKLLPFPMFNGLRLLLNGRDFKLPFDICNPLPPGQPKPDEWRKMTKNRFIGDSLLYWKKSPHLIDGQSKCVCKPEDGCDESCQNRIMLYECDENNCNVGKEFCNNRAFADLQERKALGGKYRIGVEVIKTSDRGHGVRANRCFEPNQIIMEYTGEIITEEECENRMNTKYKDNECYYLMSFDQNMIIDATTGSIARFVNHSCNPNSRMVKWIVAGQPRVALFAGDKPIATGDELTYDYNFDPFSAKNVQKCLCGEPNCRGVLGPRPREAKPKPDVKQTVKKAVKAVKAGKRKLQELAGEGSADQPQAKKRRIKIATGIKRSISKSSVKAVKGVAKGAGKGAAKSAAKGAATVKKRVSSISINAKTALGTKRYKAPNPAKKAAVRKSSSGRVIKTYSKSALKAVVPSRASSLTIVAAGVSDEKPKPQKKASPKKKAARKSIASPRKGLELSRAAKIRLVSPEATITAKSSN